MLLTWSFMIGGIWTGMSGRPLLYAGSAALSTACFLSMLVFLTWYLDAPGEHSGVFVALLPWLPWTLATCFILKAWGAAESFWRIRLSQLVAMGAVGRYLCAWTAGTCGFLVLAWLVSPRVVWFREVLYLTGLLIFPLARIGAAPLAVARSRHR
jgi:hypothetical protein